MDDHKCEHHKTESSKDDFNDACACSCHEDKVSDEYEAGDCCDVKTCDHNDDKGCCCPPAP